MIIIKIQGGLGNQMFNYALGRKLSLLHHTDLLLDISSYNNYSRSFQLNEFQIKSRIANLTDIERIRDGKHLSIIQSISFKIRRKTAPYYQKPYVIDHQFLYDSNILKGIDNTYYAGTWQSEKYFHDIRQGIIEDFSFKLPLDKKSESLANELLINNSVCLHVRRGDYLSDPAAVQHIGTLDLNYYQRAVNLISSMVNDPVFYLFSDDHEWVKGNLSLPESHKVVFCTSEGNCPMLDFRLMQQCKHFIIANSTFSWWAAWLAQYSKKTVIAPGKWFKSDNYNTNDVVPPSWLRI